MNKKKKTVDEKMSRLLEKHGKNFWQAVFGLVSSSCGLCECGRSMELRNVHMDNFIVCERCRTFSLIGANLYSSWRHETEDVWRKNEEFLKKAREIEPYYPLMKEPFESHGELLTADQQAKWIMHKASQWRRTRTALRGTRENDT